MLDSGIDVNAVVRVPENLQGRCTLLHVASLYGKAEVVICLVERIAHISFRNANNNTEIMPVIFSTIYFTIIFISSLLAIASAVKFLCP